VSDTASQPGRLAQATFGVGSTAAPFHATGKCRLSSVAAVTGVGGHAPFISDEGSPRRMAAS
jgi:hypothetical protein